MAKDGKNGSGNKKVVKANLDKEVTMITNSLKGGPLPDGFIVTKPIIVLNCDLMNEQFPVTEKVRTLFVEGARVRAQRVLRTKGKAALEGRTKFTLKLSELFEKSSGMSTEAVVDGVVSGDITLTPEQEKALLERITKKYGAPDGAKENN
jgi:hypothetical protein